ncbi:PTS sugar transporter subunit IIA [Gorillibacterium sp. sgz500922]|uniref:PTS sugar transporter subunit IIA n=1 Tax=Gorillibacterium sp. sgz500922 TaxID=3446694 RepID=UPI003F67979F
MLEKWLGKKTKQPPLIEIAAPLTGKAVSLAEVPDEAFSGGFMGEGIAIEPSEGLLVAPFDGTVAHLIDTHHAVIVEHASGLQLLLHIGVNTVGLKGSGFTAQVKTGDRIRSGQPLIEFDPEAIRRAGYPLITPVVVANMEAAQRVSAFEGETVRSETRLLQVALQV